MIGRTVAHYEILEELGSGGMGVVYRARDSHLRRAVALKVLPPELAGSRERLARFEVEARAVASLNHPNIVTLYSIEQDADLRFMTMELVEGRTLDRVTPVDGFELERLLPLAIQLADGIASAHEKGVAHRDLKPGNVMLDPQGRIKILDFGLAKLLEPPVEQTGPDAPTVPQTRVGQAVGTAPFMAPEQVRGQPVDHRADIFALGVLLYLMATGRHPFAAESTAEITSGILRDEPAPVSEVRDGLPRQLGRIINLALEKDPERRFQSAKDLRNELEALNREVSTTEFLVQPPKASLGRRARRTLATLGAAAAVALALVAWWLWPRPAPLPPVYLAVAGVPEIESELDPVAVAGPEVVRRRLAGVSGVYVIGERDNPKAELRLDVDARAVGDRVRLSYRLRHRAQDRELGGSVVEGRRRDLFGLVDRVGREVTEILDRQLELEARFDPPAAPSEELEAVDAYLEGVAGLEAARTAAQFDGASAAFERAVARDPEFAEARALAGRALLDAHRLAPEAPKLEAALARCSEAARRAPDLAQAHVCEGESLRRLDRPIEAIESFLRAITASATVVEAYDGIRAAHQVLRNREAALQTWQRVIELHPRFWAGHLYLGGFRFRDGDYEGAIASYRRALELAPDNALTYVSLGGSYYFLGRWEEAVQALQKSIQVRPTFGGYSNLGSTYFILRRFEEAIGAFERAAEFDDADCPTYGNLAKAYHWSGGRRAEAAATFERAIEMCEARLAVQARDPDAMILLAHYLAMRGERESSLEMLDRAQRLRPEDGHYHYLAGLIHGQLGERERALDWLERAVRSGYSLAEIRNTVELDGLRDEPRFRALLGAG